jgi:hypothetical protein
MNSHPLGQWFTAFLWTNLLELPVYVVMLRKYFAEWWVPWVLTLVVNSCTHPALWYLLPYVELTIPHVDPYVVWAVIAEGCVVCAEMLLILVALGYLSPSPRPSVVRRLRIAFFSSLIANLTSAVLGSVLLSRGR